MTVTASQFSRWNDLALLGVIMAMAVGGCACSTAGAIKTLRIGIIFKGFWRQMRMILMPEQGIVIEKIHHFRDTILGDNQIAAAGLIFLAYVFLYFVGSLVGVLCGYQFLPSLFESVSAAANVGHTIGITATTMPAVLKVTYILQMWIGRFEFMAIFGLFGFLISWVKGR
jgi:trk system potassium uptake protein TrkH